VRLRDSALLGIRSALRRPGRTLLTVIAVALGSGLLVALAAIAEVADTRIIGELGKGGPATAIKVAAAAPNPLQPDSDAPQAGPARDLTQGTLDAIRRASDMSAVVPVLASPVIVIPPPRGFGANVGPGPDPDRGLPRPYDDSAIGVDLTQVRDLPITVLAGRLPRAGSLDEVAVTQGYLDRLGIDVRQPSAVLGSELELGSPQATGLASIVARARWSRARITGVVAQQVGDGGLLTSIELTRTERDWQLAGSDGSAIGIPPPTSEFTGFVVVASSLDSIHTVRAEITTLGYSTTAPEHLVATVQKYLHVVDIVLGAIGGIALLIAALGIANALLAAVRERRREIGVLKAIGARDSDVLRWFAFEAIAVGLAGGALGTLCGLGAALAVGRVVNGYLVDQGLEGVDLGGIPPWLVIAGVAGSALLALAAAAWPALRAARLPAREAIGAV
jgi:putative ABC transport system permease protein